MLCQPSMPTARSRITAFNNSWPIPAAAAAISAANRATMPAPTTPPAIPVETQNPRRGAPALAARTMPTISAASSTSRNTMMAAPSITTPHLFCYDMTACGLRVEITKELVFSGLQRADIHHDFLSAGDHLLAPELGAFEFFRRRVVVFHRQGDLLAGRNLDFSRLKLMVLDHQRVRGLLRRDAGCHCKNQGEREEDETRHTGAFRKLPRRENATKSHY